VDTLGVVTGQMIMSRESLSTATAKRRLRFLLWVSAGCLLAGCGDQVRVPSSEELARFEASEATGPSVDMDRILQAKITTGPYHTAIGDILQLEMPKILNAQSFDGTVTDGRETYACRIGDDGTIMLPVVGPFVAAGKSLAEIEAGVLVQYYPRYIKQPFPIYASVLQYNTRQVSIVGAVARPGVYSLRPDQMSLVALLMEAGGIVQRGAAVIRIARRNAGASLAPQMQASLPMRGADRPPSIRRAQVMTGEPAEPLARVAAFQIAFEREGPLRTTGWLAVADQDRTLARTWCDLASEAQLSAFIRAAAVTSQQLPIGEMQTRLGRLARALGSSPLGRDARVVARDCGWQVEARRLVTHLSASPVKKQVLPRWSAAVRSVALAEPEPVTTLVLPVKGLNIPFADVALQEGDSVVVEWPREQLISVVGLVRNPGNFPYPQNTQYNLIQAIGFAGGLDMVADPRYVSIYRLQPDGTIESVTVQLVNLKNERDLTEALALPVKPGDVISVEHTLRTRTNVFFDRYFRITFGLFVDPTNLWNNGN
jgi:protein involved in polysaccharide export with SLBB domain